MNSYKAEDPPPDQKIAVPVSVPNFLYKLGIMSTEQGEFNRAIGELTLIAFYFLLRVGEYTPPAKPKASTTKLPKKKKKRSQRRTLTQQFRVRDVTFWDKDHNIIPKRSKLSKLLKATSASMRISNQKNGKKGQTIYAEAIHIECCPIKALANRVHHILSRGGNQKSLLCDYYVNTTKQQIRPKMINNALHRAIQALGLHEAGITTKNVSSHSLRSGGATAMKIAGESDIAIQKAGRWTSTTFITYIQHQIAAVNNGVSKRMSKVIPYCNITVLEPEDSIAPMA